jgi:hypothetical protein
MVKRTTRNLEGRLAALEAALEAMPDLQTEEGARQIMEQVWSTDNATPHEIRDRLTAEYVTLTRGRPTPRNPASIQTEADRLEQASPELLAALAGLWDRLSQELTSTNQR